MPPAARRRAAGALAFAARATSVAAALSTLACGGGDGDATGPAKKTTVPPSLRVVAGAGATDTVLAPLPQELVVEVRDSSGMPRADAVVRFEGGAVPAGSDGGASVFVCPVERPETCGDHLFATPSIDTTGADGRAKARLRLGTVAGAGKVYVTVAALGLRDSVAFTVLPGRVASIAVLVPDTAVHVGATYQLGSSLADAFGNPRNGDAIAYGTADSAAAVSAAGVVTGVLPGRAALSVTSGGVSSTAFVSVVPDGHVAAYMSPTAATPGQLVEFDLDGSNFHVRAAATGGWSTMPVWLPGTSSITFTAFGGAMGLELVTVDAQGAVTAAVPDPALLLTQRGQYSRDGAYLYFDANFDDQGAVATAIFRVRTAGAAAAERVSAVNGGWQPSPSTDGGRVAFLDPHHLAVLTVSSGAATSLGVAAWGPRWAPGSETIAYTTNDGSDGPIALAGADGTGQRLVSDVTYNADFDWSPDGQWLVASRDGRLVLVRVSSGEELPLRVHGDVSLYEPAWKR